MGVGGCGRRLKFSRHDTRKHGLSMARPGSLRARLARPAPVPAPRPSFRPTGQQGHETTKRMAHSRYGNSIATVGSSPPIDLCRPPIRVGMAAI